MDQLFFPVWPLHLNDTMRVAVGLLIAGLAGEGVARFARFPRVTGYSLAGLVLGPFVFGWFSLQDVGAFRMVIDLTLALLLFELGVRVDIRWFKANPWILAASVAEAALTFAGAMTVLYLMGSTMGFSATVAAIAIGTSPAVIMRVAAELRSDGQVTQRLLIHTALNVLYSVVLSKLIVGGMHGAFRNDWAVAVLHPLFLLSGSLLVGAAIAEIFRLLRRRFDLSDEQGVAILFGLLLLALGVLQMLNLPTMLAPLLAGAMVKVRDRRPHLWPRHFGTAGGVLVILLFVATGGTLTGKAVMAGGVAALAVIVVRTLGKCAGVAFFGALGGLSSRQSLALGVALTPMSGVAFLLVEDIRGLYPDFAAQVGAVVLCMVAILQLVGPVAAQWALLFSKEAKGREL